MPEALAEDLVLSSLEYGRIRPWATVYESDTLRLALPTADDNNHTGGVFGGFVAYWAGEAAPVIESQASFGRVVWDAKKLAAFGAVPNSLLDDAASFQVFMRSTVGRAFAYYEDRSFINGTGDGEPLGILQSPCAVNVTRAAAGHVSQADVGAMLARLLPQCNNSPGLCWLANQSTWSDICNMWTAAPTAPSTGAAGTTPWVDRDGNHPTLCGIPVVVTEHASALGTAGDLTLADRSMYTIATRKAYTVDISPHFRFGSDQTAVRISERIDGKIWMSTAVTPEHGASTVSAVVKLN